MLLSLALLLIVSLLTSSLFERLRLPRILGIMLAGAILGPTLLNWLNDPLLAYAADLRQLALVILLLRAGLSLDLSTVKSLTAPIIRLSIIPPLLEMLSITGLAMLLLKLSFAEAALLGTMLAAVSPAVIIPSMLKIMNEGYGQKRRIPQMLLATASLDNVFVMVFFAAVLAYNTGDLSIAQSFIELPLSLVTAVGLAGILATLYNGMRKFFAHSKITEAILLFSLALFCLAAESSIKLHLPYSAIVAILSLAIFIRSQRRDAEPQLFGHFNAAWSIAELLLFGLLGATIQFTAIQTVLLPAVLLISAGLCIRLITVYASLAKLKFTRRERLFSSLALMPKATIQASLAAIPLAYGIESGQMLLSITILAILISAPLGSLSIEKTYQKLLEHDAAI